MSVKARRGVTLLELLVALSVLAIAMTVVGVPRTMISSVVEVDPSATTLRDARARAVRTGRPVTVSVERGGETRQATAFPNGSVVEDATPRRTGVTDGGGRASR